MTTAAVPPRISVVVPTRDRRDQVRRLLDSLTAGPDRAGVEIVVNDDVRSAEPLEPLIEDYRRQGVTVTLLHDNPTRAAGRRRGTARAGGGIVLHLDSDMTAQPGLLEECGALLADPRYDALVIPEISVGEGFWARCKVLEKRCQDGDPLLQSLRCLRRSLYDQVGGHDEALVWAEDKDLDLRVRATGARVAGTTRALLHHEGDITLRGTMRTKAHYAHTAGLFAAKHPAAFAAQASPGRLLGLARQGWRLSRDPVLVAGLVLLKSCEYLAAGSVLLAQRLRTAGRGRRG
ncbi:glycosyltransferase family 2 protein [Streptacidiphilus cavernicola]|uniref:Glycosyltransferase family 2 protein n=1 Tax=Streptacidiphilus cavernicola TaxID=3342716 RepID=A0ABV6VZF4_9ACTN